MIIKADKDGMDVIKQLCDIALKVNGLQAMESIKIVMDSTTPLEEVNGK